MRLNDMIDLSGKIALVTGGTGFLGAQCCEALLECNAHVYAVSRNKSTRFSDGLSERYPCSFDVIEADMSSKENVEWIVTTVIDEAERLDILINASCDWPSVLEFDETSWDDLEKCFRSNVVSPLYLTKLAFQQMKDAGRGGKIVNITSMYGKVAPDHRIYRGGPRGSAIGYGAAKAALLQATRYLAEVGAAHDIRVNSISPGPFPRPGTFDNGHEWFHDELCDKTMLGRVGLAHEIKGATLFLASEMSSYVTGTDLAVDGGWTAL